MVVFDLVSQSASQGQSRQSQIELQAAKQAHA